MENTTKRRSFIDIRRKSLTITNLFSEETEKPEADTTVEKLKDPVKSYLESLVKEKQDWKDILTEKKNMKKESKEKYEFESLLISKEDVENYITPEHKELLESKPDYLEMLKTVKKYMDTVVYLNKYKEELTENYYKTYNQVQINTKLLVDEMCGDNLCEICNIKNCEISEHKFMV